ncbi:NUDIX domain-containing protein [Boseongicola sp. H5]|uniref:NUDIX hydrolase n=1 Tax=Boseongicola sp. H5 TaxID=2763261 RepID=UPI001D0AA49A|nr:NUDIX domain-containing protein [Boseongicola sp. H5]
MGQADARLLDKTAIRDAATIIMLRDAETRPRVLMGQRGRTAAFMPSKFVFPGGAVDAVDATIPLARAARAEMAAQLAAKAEAPANAVIAAATRELWEETGLLLGRTDDLASRLNAPRGWRGYLATGHLPDGPTLEFIFRAITPPGRPRRFDARFFVADASDLANDPDDFSRAEDELSHLQWVPLDTARAFDMPFITEVVLAELAARLNGTAHHGVPFFNNADRISRFERL